MESKYSEMNSRYSVLGRRMAGINGIQVFQNKNSSEANDYLHYLNYSYSGLIPNKRALSAFRPVHSKADDTQGTKPHQGLFHM